MTTRVYLATAKFTDEAPQAGDLVAERIFVHASEVPEIWVETENVTVPGPGRAAGFALAYPLGVGFRRIAGTVERVVNKHTRELQRRSE